MYKEMKDILAEQNNTTLTQNGDIAFKSTYNEVLNLFALMGAMRNNVSDFMQVFVDAYSNNNILTLAALLNLRDIRSGIGERKLFREALEYVVHNEEDEELVLKVMNLIPNLGRWDDLLVFLDSKYEKRMANLVEAQLMSDLASDYPSLCAKWLPSENASNKDTIVNARKLMLLLDLKPKQYRKILSELRNKINIVETNLVKKEYNNIDYNKVPGRAMNKYTQAFYRNDEHNFSKYLEGLKTGESKVNTSSLYPHDIIKKVYGYYVEDKEVKLSQSQWDNLERNDGGKTIVVRDGSGSMSGEPIIVATALSIFLSEQLKDGFKDSFITFSANPEIVTFKEGMSLREKVRLTHEYDDMSNTNIEKVYDLIFETMKNKPETELDNIIIISDMEFDEGTSNIPTYESLKNKFNKIGKKVPNIVFWNVDAKGTHFPTTDLEYVKLVSGNSHHIIKSLFNSDYDMDAYTFMIQTLNPYLKMLGVE